MNHHPSMDLHVLNEITSRLSAPSMTWKKLDMCFKWRMVRDYLADRSIHQGDTRYEHMRFLVQRGGLTGVEYARTEQRIKRLNQANDIVCVGLDDAIAKSTQSSS